MASITIEQVISFLTSEKKEIEENLYRLIFGNNAYRIDIIKELKTNIEKYNISLYSSILSCLDDTFVKLMDNEQIKYIQELIDKICVDYNSNKLYTKYNFKRFKIKKNELLQEIQTYKNTIYVLKFFTYYFNINIFILDVETNKLYCEYNDNKYNKYKTNIILCRSTNNFYEPIHSKNSINYDCNNSLLKYILNDYKNIIQTFSEDEFVIRSDEEINIDIIEEQKIKEEIIPIINTNTNLELKEEIIPNTNSELKEEIIPIINTNEELKEEIIPTPVLKQAPIYYSIKMKLGEIQEIALKYDISIEKKNGNKTKLKTKSELTSELDKKLKL